LKRDSEIWANPNDPNQLIAERAEMWWDDGSAEPEWFVDRGSSGGADGGRPWAQSNLGAVAQLGGMFALLTGVFGLAYVTFGDGKLRPAAPTWVHSYPVDMHKQFGMENLPKDGSWARNGARRAKQHGVVVEEEEEE